jgi:diguanylate cyclase (GGDEF)-like protein
MTLLIVFCFFTSLFLLAQHADAASTDLQISNEPSYALSRYFSALKYDGSDLTLEEVRRKREAGEFSSVDPRSTSATNFGLTRSKIWLHQNFTTDAILPERWLLEVAHSSLDSVDVFIAEEGGDYLRQHAGDQLPFAAKALPHRHHLFELNLKPSTGYSLYVRAESSGTLSVPVNLWQPDALWADDQVSYALLSCYFGLLAGLMVYNLFLFLSLRDKLYLFYVAFIGFLALGQAGLAGLTGQFMWPNNALLTHLSPTGGVSLAGIFGVYFAHRFLGSTPRDLKMQWVMPLLGIMFATSFTITLFVSYFVAAVLINITSLLFALSAFLMGGVSLYRGQPGARFFVLAWVSLLLSILVIALHNLGILPSNGFTANALMFGSAAEMLLLSLALADRINSLQRLQDQAQQDALKVNREMVDALRESERQLESRVTARTAELEQTNDELTRNKALLEKQANHDALTGLANRKLLKDRLLGAQLRSQRNQKNFALLVIDLDRFKQVNDRFGHIAGDEVLIQVARRLQSHLREVDTVARIGGDEFVVILESVRSRDAILILQGHLLADVARPILVREQQEVSIGMSIGMAIYPEDTTDIESLFHIADRQMYAAKPSDAVEAD